MSGAGWNDCGDGRSRAGAPADSNRLLRGSDPGRRFGQSPKTLPRLAGQEVLLLVFRVLLFQDQEELSFSAVGGELGGAVFAGVGDAPFEGVAFDGDDALVGAAAAATTGAPTAAGAARATRAASAASATTRTTARATAVVASAGGVHLF